jgi:hypothetical protein
MQTVLEDESKVFAAICAASPMTPSIAAKVLKMFKNQNLMAHAGKDYDLSAREKEILSLLGGRTEL